MLFVDLLVVRALGKGRKIWDRKCRPWLRLSRPRPRVRIARNGTRFLSGNGWALSQWARRRPRPRLLAGRWVVSAIDVFLCVFCGVSVYTENCIRSSLPFLAVEHVCWSLSASLSKWLIVVGCDALDIFDKLVAARVCYAECEPCMCRLTDSSPTAVLWISIWLTTCSPRKIQELL